MKNKNSKVVKTLVIEIGKAFVNLIFGNAHNKIGLSLILLIPGIGFVIIAAFEKLKYPEILYVIGTLFILASIRLILKRYSELKRKTEN